MIYFDLDQVLRNLHPLVWGYTPKTWGEKTHETTIFKYILQNLSILIDSPKTEYFDIIYNYCLVNKEINILSTQPKEWQQYTDIWLKNNLKGIKINKFYVSKPNDKLDLLKNTDILVDDNPNFKDYSKIALIVYPYNQHILKSVKPYYIIKDTLDLIYLLEKGV